MTETSIIHDFLYTAVVISRIAMPASCLRPQVTIIYIENVIGIRSYNNPIIKRLLATNKSEGKHTLSIRFDAWRVATGNDTRGASVASQSSSKHSPTSTISDISETYSYALQ